ncbi:sugar phosphate isomerase/epimerase family protein [Paludibaculum fermentans]|uniref:Sugar phosphate isomerase/epimerase n=1 Tax=Paludibaculum fermentans TaxID=1473598 RepID=A0A7S7SJK1_PALFE|nr:sugar phosphate isomerase/epimerase [Paludibaculum fermentans]QOY87324.1 sugar phosphate isomerase/epimerase [Paludibaculum fermentans]
MSQIKGPAIFLAQFMGDEEPFNSLPNITAWAKELGYIGVQIPSWDSRVIDLKKAAESKTYCQDLKGQMNGLEITELASHLQGQLVAVHPAYDELFDGFAAPEVRGNPKARAKWAVEQLKLVIKASKNLGLSVTPSFTGALLWPTVYPWPQRPAGLVEEAFKELAKRWKPIFDFADKHGVDFAFELHPGEDLHDGLTFERLLEATGNHPRLGINYDPSHFVLQCMDYVGFIDAYGPYIKAFHVKDAEFVPSAKAGVYGGYADWKNRPGRFRSLGDGQVDFGQVFSRLTAAGYKSWAVLEWECCFKDAAQGAAEGAPFIEAHLIDVPKKAFDDFAGGASDAKRNRRILGLE